MLATYLEKEAGKCPHMTHNHLPYPGHSPGKSVEIQHSQFSSFAEFPVAPPPYVGKWARRGK